MRQGKAASSLRSERTHVGRGPAERPATPVHDDFFRAVFHAVQAPIFTVRVEPEGNYVLGRANPAFEDVTHTESAAVEGVRLDDADLPEADLDAIKANFDRCVRENGPIEYEQALEMSGGRTWWTRLAPLHDESGRIAHLVGTSVDITETRRSELLLRRLIREQRLVSDCNMAIIRAQNEAALLNETCRIIRDAGYATACVCLGRDGYAGDIRLGACSTTKESPAADLESPDGLPAMVLRTKRASRVPDLAEAKGDVRAWGQRVTKLGFRSAISLPMLDSGGVPLGALVILSVEPEDFAAGDVRIFQELVDNLAYALSSMQAREHQYQVDRVNSSRLRLLQFASGHTVDELLEQTLNEAEKLTGSLIGFYHFVDEDQVHLALQDWSTRTKAEFCTAEGKGSHYPISEAGVWVDCVYARKPVVHNDYASLSHKKGLPEGHAPIVRELVVPVMRGGTIRAILGVGNKPTDYRDDDIKTVSLLADLAWEIADRRIAEAALRGAEEEVRRVLVEMIGAIALTIEMRDAFTAGHQERVACLAAEIAKEMGLDEEAVEGVRIGATIHDLGKIRVPVEILAGTGKLSRSQWAIIRTHPSAGAEIVRGIRSPWPIEEMILQHHERLDGSGYPAGLKGEDICVEARILAVADVVEAMASHRPYRPALGVDAALDAIIEGRGMLFDEQAVDTCVGLFREHGFELDVACQ